MGARWHWAQRLIKQAPLAPTPTLPQGVEGVQTGAQSA